MKFSDQDLQNFLEGVGGDQQTHDIEVALENDDQLAARLMSMDTMGASVKSAFDHLPEPSRVDVLENDIGFEDAKEIGHSMNWMSLAAALVVGVGLGWSLFANTGPSQSDWRQYVANYQVLYGVQTIDHLDPTQENLKDQFARAETALGQSFDINRLQSVDGLALKRAQVLELDGQPLIQIVYQSKDGLPIALCVFKQTTDVENTFMANLAANSWQTDEFGFLLIGGTDLDQTAAWSNQFKSVL